MSIKKVWPKRSLVLSSMLVIAVALITTWSAGSAIAASASEIDHNATQALYTLYNTFWRKGSGRQGEGHPYIPEHCQGGLYSSGSINLIPQRLFLSILLGKTGLSCGQGVDTC